MGVRLLVTGGRDYADREHVWSALDRVHARRPVALLIHGGATGADALADEWARARGVDVLVFPARWREYFNGPVDRGAGPRRNADMVRNGRPDGAVAFPGGAGTADCVRRCEAAGVRVWHPGKSPS